MKKNCFNTGTPKDHAEKYFLVSCPDYCESGHQVATFDGDCWRSSDTGADITEYVTGWVDIEKITVSHG